MLVLPLVLAAAELTLRLPAVAERLPRPELTLWHATNVQAKLDYLQALEADRGIDVLFVGNSTVLAGLDPQVFDSSRGQRAEEPGSFNGALEGIPAAGVLEFVKLYFEHSRPALIVYGITPQDLNDNSPTGRDLTSKVARAPLMAAAIDDSLLGRATAWLLANSALFRYRTVLYRWLLNGAPEAPPAVYFDERGYVDSDERLADVPQAERGRFYNNDGVLAYDPHGAQTAALRALIAFVRGQGSTLVLINMPLADDYYGNFAEPDDYPSYLAALSAVADEGGVSLWNAEEVAGSPRIGDAGFADFNHLNRAGAQQLSAYLGDRLHTWAGALTQAKGREP